MTTYWILLCSKQKASWQPLVQKQKNVYLVLSHASGRDQVPSDDPHLKTKICIFIVMRKDGTPLNVTSVSEEDIIEICVTLWHTHTLGVLWYLTMESVALFHMTEESDTWCHKGNRIAR